MEQTPSAPLVGAHCSSSSYCCRDCASSSDFFNHYNSSLPVVVVTCNCCNGSCTIVVVTIVVKNLSELMIRTVIPITCSKYDIEIAKIVGPAKVTEK